MIVTGILLCIVFVLNSIIFGKIYIHINKVTKDNKEDNKSSIKAKQFLMFIIGLNAAIIGWLIYNIIRGIS